MEITRHQSKGKTMGFGWSFKYVSKIAFSAHACPAGKDQWGTPGCSYKGSNHIASDRGSNDIAPLANQRSATQVRVYRGGWSGWYRSAPLQIQSLFLSPFFFVSQLSAAVEQTLSFIPLRCLRAQETRGFKRSWKHPWTVLKPLTELLRGPVESTVIVIKFFYHVKIINRSSGKTHEARKGNFGVVIKHD